jgi:hypothetical protein
MVIQPSTYAPLPQRASAPATQTPPQQPTDQIDLSGLQGLQKFLVKTGEGMAKIGGWGGAAVGAGLGVAINGGLSGGLFLPVITAFLIGTDCAKARQGAQNLDKGAAGLLEAAGRGEAITPARGAASAVTICACMAELAAGYTLGGLPGLLVAMPAMLGTAYVMGRAAGQAESYVLDQALDKTLKP